MTTKRPIAAIKLHEVTPGGIAMTATPVFEWMDPATLLVDSSYQRGLSERSYRLIRKIVEAWDWKRFRPPVVAMTPDGPEVIDGQHTAIAAVCHPMVDKIPVMLISAEEMAERADAFIGLNKDRIAMTPTQMHHAATAAGDEDALTVAQVCQRAGVRVLRLPPGNGSFKVGDTLAVGAIYKLINRRGAMRARQLLQALVEAKLAPVSVSEIRAAETLIYEEEYAGNITLEDITTIALKLGSAAMSSAKLFAATHNIALFKALAVVWYKEKPRGRRSAA